jgi:hypothetical protein
MVHQCGVEWLMTQILTFANDANNRKHDIEKENTYARNPTGVGL